MAAVPEISLNDGSTIPQLGLGVLQMPSKDVVAAIASALEAGYRLIDTAAAYGNEEGVGRAIAQSDIPRDELYITTKVWNADQGYESTLRAFDASLARLGLDTVDLYLIHWPLPKRDLYAETWKALEKIQADGRARSIGVSNFGRDHLERLAAESDVVPAVNQLELHPRLPQTEMRSYDAGHGVVTQAWSPLGRAGIPLLPEDQGERRAGQGVLDDPLIGEIAKHHDRSPAQVVLRWHIQLGNVVIPKSVNPARIAENIDLFDFELTSEEMAGLTALGPEERIGPHPADMDVM